MRALLAAAGAFSKANKAYEASAVLRSAIERDPSNMRIYEKLASTIQAASHDSDLIEIIHRGVEFAVRANHPLGPLLKAVSKSRNAELIAHIGQAAAANDSTLTHSAAQMLVTWGRPDLSAILLARSGLDKVPGNLRDALKRALAKQLKLALDQGDQFGFLQSAVALSKIGEIDDNVSFTKLVGKATRQIRSTARGLIERDELDGGAKLLRDALKIAPDDEILLKDFALLAEKLGAFGEASEAWENLGNLLSANQFKERALSVARKGELWEAAIRIQRDILYANPADAAAAEQMDAILRRASIAARNYMDNQEFGKAVALAKAILKEEPNSVAGHSLTRKLRKHLRAEMGQSDPAAANEAAVLSLAIDETDALALKVHALSLQSMGKPREAARAWETLATTRNGKASLLRRAAQQYRLAGDRIRSQEIYSRLAASEIVIENNGDMQVSDA